MYCRHLSLLNFRNYVRLELELPPGFTVIVGDNGEGKSNLLEAIGFLSTTKSMRATGDREVINWRAAEDQYGFARVSGLVERIDATTKLEFIISPTAASASKRIRVNDVPRRTIDAVGLANVVSFSPQDLELVEGAPAYRRKFLDVMIAQVDSRYVRALSHYGKVLAQRNSLLKRIRSSEGRVDQLHFWDKELAAAGGILAAKRRQTIAQIDEISRRLYPELSGTGTELKVSLVSNVAAGDTDSAEQAAESIASRLRETQSRERELGVTIIGPHRDDLSLVTGGREVTTYGSRGQKRLVALALKLAESDFIQKRSGEQPILLLDDVLSELDESRRGFVLDRIRPGQQVVLTSVDLGHLNRLDSMIVSRLRVKDGILTSEQQSYHSGVNIPVN